ncbi:MAG: hypothetical protein IKV61_03135 [Clostridia bacterium]|nr:hypothetical protein [Clostridia bacterium]
MSDVEYCKMLEIPVNSCDIVIKNSKRRKKDVVNKVIKKVNLENDRKANTEKEVPEVKPVSTAQEKVRSNKIDVLSVQVVAIFALIVGIILTNIFWEDSGMNNLLKQVFSSKPTVNDAVYTSFNAVSPSKAQDVTINNGIMTVSKGSIYSPCDGVVESVSSDNGIYTLTIKHSETFSTVISGLSLCYASVGENIYSTIPIGYSEGEMSVCMFNNDAILTSFTLDGSDIVWIN